MSSEQYGKGISRKGVDAAFEADEAHKSNLILEAYLLREQGQSEEASPEFAEAAAIEERLRDRCVELGLAEKSYIHAFAPPGAGRRPVTSTMPSLSATLCWAAQNCRPDCASVFSSTPSRSVPAVPLCSPT